MCIRDSSTAVPVAYRLGLGNGISKTIHNGKVRSISRVFLGLNPFSRGIFPSLIRAAQGKTLSSMILAGQTLGVHLYKIRVAQSNTAVSKS